MSYLFKQKVAFLLLIVFFFSGIGSASLETPAPGDHEPGVLIICFTPEVAGDVHYLEEAASQLHQAIGSAVLEDSEDLGLEGVQYIALSPEVSVEAAMIYYLSDPAILWAEPNYIVRIPEPVGGMFPGGEPLDTPPATQISLRMAGALFSSPMTNPNDPEFARQWNLKKVEAPAAWDISAGSASVVIAVIDTGIDFSNPDFSERIWTNSREIPQNGIDDDGNGFIDDIHGWDFVNADNDPGDDYGHGTAVSSVIAARVNNGFGIAGMMPDVRIMPLKAGDQNGILYSRDIAKATQYARENGAHLVLCSFGKYVSDTLERLQIQQSPTQIFICAAGNDGNNNDLMPFFPASYPLSHIISVAAAGRNDELPAWSNFGQATVHVGAPGVDIPVYSRSHVPVTASGTSYAAPHVAGVACLLLSKDPSLSPLQVKNLILASADPGPLSGFTISCGRINAYRALSSLTPSPTTVPTTVSPTPTPAGGDADFSAVVTTGPAPLTVQFTDTSTGNPTGWSWNFGDGKTSTIQNPVHTYTNAGIYSVSLRITTTTGGYRMLKTGLISVQPRQ